MSWCAASWSRTAESSGSTAPDSACSCAISTTRWPPRTRMRLSASDAGAKRSPRPRMRIHRRSRSAGPSPRRYTAPAAYRRSRNHPTGSRAAHPSSAVPAAPTVARPIRRAGLRGRRDPAGSRATPRDPQRRARPKRPAREYGCRVATAGGVNEVRSLRSLSLSILSVTSVHPKFTKFRVANGICLFSLFCF